MAFQEVTRMHLRKQLAELVLVQGIPVAVAARQFGVSRVTAHMWVTRARDVGIAELAELSRRPKTVHSGVSPEAVARLLELKRERPTWGAKKLRAKLWPEDAPMSLRTADRELKKHGLTRLGYPRLGELCRFERGNPNELWQMDYKGVGRRPYAALSVIDDCTRFCVGFKVVSGTSSEPTFEALWDIFGDYGLPECFLTDNGAPFSSVNSLGPTPLQVKLWLLGIRTIQGRPYHPQTQGKVERFHLTAEQELGPLLRLANISDIDAAMQRFREDYNWERPHEALELRVPGARYANSKKPRPSKVPAHHIPEGSLARKVDAAGKIRYKTTWYRAGIGLIKQYVELRDENHGLAMYFANVRLGSLADLKV